MKAISVEIPYATLLVTGDKTWETRTWLLHRNVVGERVAIATVDRFGGAQLALCRKPFVRKALGKHGIRVTPVVLGLVPGAVVGTVRFVRCLPALAVLDMIRNGETGARDEERLGWYRNGWWAWEAVEPEMFDTPIPAKGSQRFWSWDESVLDDGDSVGAPQ